MVGELIVLWVAVHLLPKNTEVSYDASVFLTLKRAPCLRQQPDGLIFT